MFSLCFRRKISRGGGAGRWEGRQSDVTVVLGNTTRIDLKLSPQVTETITVTAAAPVVDVRQTGLAASVSEDQIENLPLLGRDFRDLAQLTPGVSATFGDRIAFNGARGITTDLNIDGADNNSDFFREQRRGTRAPFTFSPASIPEFQVIRSAFTRSIRKAWRHAQRHHEERHERLQGPGVLLHALGRIGRRIVPPRSKVFQSATRSWRRRRSVRTARWADRSSATGFITSYCGYPGLHARCDGITSARNPDFIALPEGTRTEFVRRVEQAIAIHSMTISGSNNRGSETYL